MQQLDFSSQNAQGLKQFGHEWRPEGDACGVVALVHGLGEHVGRYQHVAEALAQAGYGLIGLDAAGHGKSEGKRGYTSFDMALESIDNLLNEAGRRYPEMPRFLYGHSMGGAMTLYYALKCRPALSGFIATSPGLAPGQPVSPVTKLLAKLMARIKPDYTQGNGLDIDNLSRDPAVVKAYKDDPLVHPKLSARLGLDIVEKGAWIIEQAPSFPGPLLLTQGDADHLVSPQATEAFARRVPAEKITYKVWPGMYHETHNEPGKAQVIQFMIDWLNRQIASQ